MQFDIITLLPQFFTSLQSAGLIGKAIEAGHIRLRIHDLRTFGIGRYRQVDDVAYGGGAGMVLRPEPIVAAIEHARTAARCRVLVLSPQGRLWHQRLARELARTCDQLILVCGRYEGIDERVTQFWADMEISIGDYVLMGGEIAAWVIVETIARLIPGVVGNPESLEMESFEQGLLDYPQYTRPANFRGYRVPEVLRSGDHARIAQWRRLQALKKTLQNRPDLLCTSLQRSPTWVSSWIRWLTALEQFFHNITVQRVEEGVDAPDHTKTRDEKDAHGSSGRTTG